MKTGAIEMGKAGRKVPGAWQPVRQ
jgi:hypothetical protein